MGLVPSSQKEGPRGSEFVQPVLMASGALESVRIPLCLPLDVFQELEINGHYGTQRGEMSG